MFIEIIGWLGSVLVVLAYALNIFKKIKADSMLYYLLNIIGCVCLIANTLYHRAIPSVVVNIVWVVIAVISLLKNRYLHNRLHVLKRK